MNSKTLLLLGAGLGLAWWFTRKAAAQAMPRGGVRTDSGSGTTITDPYAVSNAMDAHVQDERRQELALRQQAYRQATQVLEGLDTLRKYRALTMSEAQRGAAMVAIAQKSQAAIMALTREIATHGG